MRMGSRDSQRHVLPSPVPPIRLWSVRDGSNRRPVRITGNETIPRKLFFLLKRENT